MATITSLGVGSGIDAETIVTKLMTLERQPITQLQKKEASVKAKISAYGTLKGLLDTLKNAANTLGTPTSLAAFKGTSSSTNVLSATASSTASAGSYAIKVQQLATAHKMTNSTAISGDASTSINSSGSSQTFTLQVAGATSATVLNVADGATLGDLRDAINNSAAGVTANIVTDTDGVTSSSHLVLTAKDTGKAITTSTTLTGFGSFVTVGGENGKDSIQTKTDFSGGAEILGKGALNITVGSNTFAVSITDSGATLNDIASAINTAIGSDPNGVTASVVTDSNGTHLKMVANTADRKISYTAEDTDGTDSRDFSRLNGYEDTGNPLQIAQSAKLTIDGQSITSTSNSISTAIKGVTLKLTETGNTTLTVDRDQSAVSDAVDTFISAYNALNTKIRSLTAYDANNKTSNTLTGDSTTRNLQSQLSSILIGTPGTPSGTYSLLSQIGVTMGSDGSLSVSSTKLENAIATDFASVSDVLDRYGSALYTKIGNFTDTNGLLSGRTDSLNSLLKEYTKYEDTLNTRMDAIEKRYRAQFSALDTMVASMQSTSSYLTQQLAKINASS